MIVGVVKEIKDQERRVALMPSGAERLVASGHTVLVEAGAEVIIPAGGLPMLLLAREQSFAVGGALVVNGLAVVAAMAETAVKLHRLTGAAVSRRGTYAKAPDAAVREFLER